MVLERERDNNSTPSKYVNEEEKPKRKASQHSIMDYLREKSDKEIDLKKREIDIRTEELKLEREKFELEREERRQKLIQEKEEKFAFMELLKKNGEIEKTNHETLMY
ncbi:hypothetical protein FSP39_023052 [Pinctada imbricata]|uniref:Uncharacterized protein n=1 Tax=Pinctada imbricata TaxID=66713 RepID=A0AA88Y0Z5_PINIB|nr:hypothetical protein FSP39_023052 [Pinctada imbricata]